MYLWRAASLRCQLGFAFLKDFVEGPAISMGARGARVSVLFKSVGHVFGFCLFFSLVSVLFSVFFLLSVWWCERVLYWGFGDIVS